VVQAHEENPQASANAWTVPVTADSSVRPRVCPLGSIAITSAAPMQKVRYP